MKILFLMFLTVVSAHAELSSTIRYSADGAHHTCEYVPEDDCRAMTGRGRTCPPENLMCQNLHLGWSGAVDGLGAQGALPVPSDPYVYSRYRVVPLSGFVSFSASCTNQVTEGLGAIHECQLVASTTPGSGYGIPSLDSLVTVADAFASPQGSGGMWGASLSSSGSFTAQAGLTPLGAAIALPGGSLNLFTAPDIAWACNASASATALSAGTASVVLPHRFEVRRINEEGCRATPRASLAQAPQAQNILPWLCAPWVGFTELDLSAVNPAFSDALILMAQVEARKRLLAVVPTLGDPAIWSSWSDGMKGRISARRVQWEGSLLGRAFLNRLEQ